MFAVSFFKYVPLFPWTLQGGLGLQAQCPSVIELNNWQFYILGPTRAG